MSRVLIIGAGRTGLPLALVCADAGHSVELVEKNSLLCSRIRAKEPPFYEPGLVELLQKHTGNLLRISGDLAQGVSRSDFIIISVGTGLAGGKPDLSNLFDLINQLIDMDLRHKTIVLRTTLPLGTTGKINEIIQAGTGLRCGTDFFLGFCPERIVEGKALEELLKLPQIVGGVDHKSAGKIEAFFSTFCRRVILVNGSVTAEFIKLMDNAYRVTRFGFASDVAYIAEKYQINAYEAIDAANEGYERNNIPYPSCGVSGYCLTKDPLYFETSFEKTGEYEKRDSLWYQARKSLDRRETYTAGQAVEALEAAGRDIKSSRILICGATYKENIDDIRSSHGLSIAGCLREKGAEIDIWDPWIKDGPAEYKIWRTPQDAFTARDAAVFTVPHREFKQTAMMNGWGIKSLLALMRTPVLIDGCGIFKNVVFERPVVYLGTGLPQAGSCVGRESVGIHNR